MTSRTRLLAHGNLALALLSAALLFVVLNLAAARFWKQWDWTGSGLYTLSGQTRQIVQGLDRDVRIASFLVEGGEAGADVLEEIRALVDAYRGLNPKRVTVESIDPRRDPLRARTLLKEFGLDPLRDVTDVVVVECGKRRKQVRLADLVEFDPGAGYAGPPPVKALKVEPALTGAILAVTRDRQPMVRFAAGHGERDARAGNEAGFARLVEALERQDVQVSTWDALGAHEVPQGTDLVVVAGPTAAWLPAERDALAAYLQQGGRALLMLEPVLQQGAAALVPSGLEPLLTVWGITPGADVVVDPKHGVPFSGAETFYAATLPLHPVTTPLGGQPLLLVLARSLDAKQPAPADVEIHSLVETSPEAWGETALGKLTTELKHDADDHRGPLTLAYAAEARPPKSDPNAKGPFGRMVVTGDVDFASNLALDQLADRGFALNAVAWLIDENRALAIPPKDRSLAKLFLTQQQTNTLFVLLVIGFPGLAVAAGLAVWTRRRRPA